MANHRSAGRARSHAEFTAKLGLAVEEIDESQAWLKYLEQSAAVPSDATDNHAGLYAEATELTAILTAALSTARRREAADRELKRRTRRS